MFSFLIESDMALTCGAAITLRSASYSGPLPEVVHDCFSLWDASASLCFFEGSLIRRIFPIDDRKDDHNVSTRRFIHEFLHNK